ncbi:hypothetical protein BCR44DRAFT_305700 [Catenaria anguillulae PL171]|uniref:Uncharacterized protein n=1 Tax=Catenaria anguillulae PL171 TaxID=765915 RepID=A0A1Y2I355_9FUNG|nr:hypothetical protein BCR44DRAFT_305700 [Catenaria anguillulae PL171]
MINTWKYCCLRAYEYNLVGHDRCTSLADAVERLLDNRIKLPVMAYVLTTILTHRRSHVYVKVVKEGARPFFSRKSRLQRVMLRSGHVVLSLLVPFHTMHAPLMDKTDLRQHSLHLGAPSLLPLERASCQVGLLVSPPSSSSLLPDSSNPAARDKIASAVQVGLFGSPLARDSKSPHSHVLFGAAHSTVSAKVPADLWAESRMHVEPVSVCEASVALVDELELEVPSKDPTGAAAGGMVASAQSGHWDVRNPFQPLECPANPLQALLSLLDASSIQVAKQIESHKDFSAASESDAAQLLDIGTRLCSLANGLLGKGHDSTSVPSPSAAEASDMDVEQLLVDQSQEPSTSVLSPTVAVEASHESNAPRSTVVHINPPIAVPLYFMSPVPYPYLAHAAATANHEAALATQNVPNWIHHSAHTPSQSQAMVESGSSTTSTQRGATDIAETFGIRSPQPPPPLPPPPSSASAIPSPNSTHRPTPPPDAGYTPSSNRVRGPRSATRRWTPLEYATLERAVTTFGRAWSVIMLAHGKDGRVDKALARFSAADLQAKVEYEVRKKRKAGWTDEQIGVFATARPGVRGQVSSARWDEIRDYAKQLDAEKKLARAERDGDELVNAPEPIATLSNDADSEDDSIHVD